VCEHVHEVRGQNILLQEIPVFDARGGFGEALRFKEAKKGRSNCVGMWQVRLERGG